MEYDQGDLVWFDPGVGYVLPGEVIEFHRAAQVVTVQAVIDGKPQVFTLNNLTSLRRRQDLGHNGVEDMTSIDDLNEASILWNLKIRYDKELIYTYTGNILIAVNPYKMFDIYGLHVVKQYEGQILGSLPPHLFAIGSSAYSKMNKDNENQVVVISGESGAGKTESTKLIMQYLAAVNKSPSNLITEQILEASPLLESFGNAKTVRNDNSSRFGKFVELFFKDGVITGAKTTEYLLEKSRIVTQAQEERNYHVFYEMLKGLTNEQKEKYGLLSAEKYFYLNQGGSCEIDGKNDKEDFHTLLSAMQVMGFTFEEQDTIFRILSSVLHLGNIYFHRKQLKHGQEGVEIGSDAEVRWTSHLLQLEVSGITESLTSKITEARSERLMTPLNIDQALDARDAIAKALYTALFSWLVSRVNQIVCKGVKKTSISILDIFGFEEFKENSFEQLCINYANENLQYYFSKHIFKLEQQEYAKEKIEWQPINYSDNITVIQLISKKPVGIFHLLDDESNFPKATDVSFLEKCHYNHALNDLYSRPRMSSMEFGIKHYAGLVWYSADNFLDKNRDTLRPDVVDLLCSSKLPLIAHMFHELASKQEHKTLNKANGRFVTMKPRTPTVAARFQDSLINLLESMSRCNPWFVRCIKPNNEKSPMKYDMPTVLEQLRSTGMLETIKIRKYGYPIRLKFSQLHDRYRCLLRHKLPRGQPPRDACSMILEAVNGSRNQYQVGMNKIFMRESLEKQLEKERAETLTKAAVTIQKHARGYLQRNKYRKLKRGTVKLQAAVRMWVARKKYQKVKKGVIQAQATYRMKQDRKKFLIMKEERKRREESEKRAQAKLQKVAAQREEQERLSRTVAGVNHLEIPAELAFIFSKLDDWNQVHTEKNISKVIGHVPQALDSSYRLPHDVDYYAFTKFTNVYFKAHLWGMKRDPIKTPFLAKNSDQEYEDSLSLFKLVLRFMNDNNLSGKKEAVLGNYIVNKGILNNKLRDEILCQLCNQTWKNENEANCERGWLLMSNCLSAFPPSSTLYKYILKYVSDHAYNGYKAVCQKKLLQSAKVDGAPARTYPPCVLEWRANRKKANMALEVQFADGEQYHGTVESFTTGEEFASLLVRQRGIMESSGWTVQLTEDSSQYELMGNDYVLDLVAEMEVAPSFPSCKNDFLISNDNRRHKKSISHLVPNQIVDSYEADLLSIPISPKRPTSPPPEPPSVSSVSKASSKGGKQFYYGKEVLSFLEDKLDGSNRGNSSLSKSSEFKDVFDEPSKPKSRSLDNLIDDFGDPPSPLKDYGLSRTRLNERYLSADRISATGSSNALLGQGRQYAGRSETSDDMWGPDTRKSSWGSVGLSHSVLNDRYFIKQGSGNIDKAVDQLSDLDIEISSRLDRINRLMVDGGRLNPSHNMDAESFSSKDIDDPNPSQQESTNPSEVGGNRYSPFSFDMDGASSRAGDSIQGYNKARFIKHAGRRIPSAPGSHSSRAYIETRYTEKSEYGIKSSALSDTSEAPSLASHVRRVRVPSQNSDVDQFLDDLFMPVLDGNLDELSDARSLVASIKGGGLNSPDSGGRSLNRSAYLDEEVARLTGELNYNGRYSRPNQGLSHGSSPSLDSYLRDLVPSVSQGNSLHGLTNVRTLVDTIKGGGRGFGVVEAQTTSSSQPSNFGFQPIGMTSPPPTGMISPPPIMIPNLTMPLYSPQASVTSPNLAGVSGLLSPPMFSNPGVFTFPPNVMAQVPQPGIGSSLGLAHVPLYSSQGLNIPGVQMMQNSLGSMQAGIPMQTAGVDTSQILAYQQTIQRAFLQSAVAQNFQIQQQLMAQNHALQQLLQQSGNTPSSQPSGIPYPVYGGSHVGHGGARLLSPGMMFEAGSTASESMRMSSKVSFREPEESELWSSEKKSTSQIQQPTFSPVPPIPPKSMVVPPSGSPPPPVPQRTTSALNGSSSSSPFVQYSKAHSPPVKDGGLMQMSPPVKEGRKLSPVKGSSSPHSAFGTVLTELRTKRDSVDSGSPLKSPPIRPTGAPPPPPPPMPPAPELSTGTRPFIDMYGRAKTVRIGKWIWPPPKDQEEGGDNFFQFKIRQQQKKTSSHSRESIEGMNVDELEFVEWEEFDMENPNVVTTSLTRVVNHSEAGRVTSPKARGAREETREYTTKAFEYQPGKSPGSIGKLQISSEMKSKLEKLTANHSTRSSVKSDRKPVRYEEGKKVKKLEETRKSLLQEQLGASLEKVDILENGEARISRAQIQRVIRNSSSDRPDGQQGLGIPPPPPVGPLHVDTSSPRKYTVADISYSPTVPSSEDRSPAAGQVARAPREIRSSNSFSKKLDRPSSVSDKIEIEDSSDFLRSVDTAPMFMDDEFEARTLENMKTKLLVTNSAPFLSYGKVDWKLQLRKEVFSPRETLTSPVGLHLLFCQIVQDTHNNLCLRIRPDERQKMKLLLEENGVTPNNIHSPMHKIGAKRVAIDMAREWPLYFARLIPVNGGRSNPDVHYLAISHSGFRLVTRDRSNGNDILRVIENFVFKDVEEVTVPRNHLVQIILRAGDNIVLYTPRASQVQTMLQDYAFSIDGDSPEYCRAVADYRTREPTLLSFKEGDIIKLSSKNYVEKGWMHGVLNGKSGLVPVDYVTPIPKHQLHKVQSSVNNIKRIDLDEGSNDRPERDTPVMTNGHRTSPILDTWTHDLKSDVDRPHFEQDMPPRHSPVHPASPSNDGKHSLLQFAMLHFRNGEKYEMLRTADGSIRGSLKVVESMKKKGKKRKDDWTWKEQVDMVKFSKSPIQASLLKLDTSDLNKVSLECFISIMQYMNDFPLYKGQTEVDCVYNLLLNCHKNPALRDEVYCQVMKQTTNNKSEVPDSCQRGWRLFSILAAYFTCSDLLQPYLYKYLETAAYDKRRAYHGTALVCLQNLRKTFKYGGRKNVPSIEEITAITAGRNSKRQIYRLPGGTEIVINTKSTTVVQDIIEEVCGIIEVNSELEMEEFSLYCIVEGDTFTMPLAREEYILDVTTELQKNDQHFFLIFFRSVWYFNMKMDNQLYVEVVFSQMAPDYLEGLILVMPGEQIGQDYVYDIAKIAALIHKASKGEEVPDKKEIQFLLPKPALQARDIKPAQWVHMVQSSWLDIQDLTPLQAKIQFLEILRNWDLFGSTFFVVTLVEPIVKERSMKGNTVVEYILALNKKGVQFLDLVTHETLIHYPFSEVISTRKVKAEDGSLFLDMKTGNLMHQKITRFETDQVHEISRLIRQYINIEQKQDRDKKEMPPHDVTLSR